MAKQILPPEFDYTLKWKINDTARLTGQWKRTLSNMVLNQFEYSGLPDTLPAIEIEQRLLKFGYCIIYKDSRYGIVACDGTTHGIDKYGHTTNYTVSQPVLHSHDGLLGISGIVIYNTSSDWYGGSIINARVNWYARMLADIDVSLNILVINKRAVTTPVAKMRSAQTALADFYRKLEKGEYTIPLAETGVFTAAEPLFNATSKELSVMELMDLKKQVLRMFYNEFGIQTVEHKAERLITDEIDSDTDFLAANIIDQLTQRQEGMIRFMATFGYSDVKVGVKKYVSA